MLPLTRMWAPRLWATSSRGAEGARAPLKPPRPPRGPGSTNKGNLLGTASQEGALLGHDLRRLFWETLEGKWGSLVGVGGLALQQLLPRLSPGSGRTLRHRQAAPGPQPGGRLPRAPSQGGVCPTRSPKTCRDLEGPLQKESPRPCLPGARPATRAGQGGGTRQG